MMKDLDSPDAGTGCGRHALVKHLLTVGCLALVAVVYAWPLIMRLTVAIPGRPGFAGVTENVWNVGWIQQVVRTGSSVLNTDALFVPFGADLRLNTFGLLQSLLAYPFAGWLGVVGAYNLVLIVTLFLDGTVTYLLIQREVKHSAAALIAATWLMLGSPLLAHITSGRPALSALWIVSGSLLMIRSLLDQPRLWKAIGLGLLLILALLTDFQIVLFTSIWLMLYSGYRLWRDRRKMLERVRIGALGLAGVIFAIPFLGVYYPVLAGADAAGYPRPSLADMLPYSFRYWDYFSLDAIPLAVGYEFYVAAAVAVWVFRRRGLYRFWLGSAIVFLVLALGPYLQPTNIPLPLAAFSLFQPLSQFRTPSRLTMPGLIGWAMVAGFVLAYWLPKIRTRPITLAVSAVAIGGHMLFAIQHDPFRVQVYPDYTIYHQIADELGDFVLLEVPFGVRSGLERIGRGGEVVQYYQHIHGKRLLSGSMARLPSSLFKFYRAHPALLFLSGEALQIGADQLAADFADVLRWSETRYVLLHRSLLAADQAALIEAFLDRQPQLERMGVEDDLVIYRLSEQ